MILVQNRETAQWLPKRYRCKTVLFQHAVLEEVCEPAPRRSTRRRRALFAGRLIYWKGAELALQALARARDWDLVIQGDGPEAGKLRRVAAELGIEDRVVFGGTVDRATLLERMRMECDVLLFPSLHDDSPWVVAEAIGAGLPVICVDRGGPPLLAGSAGIAVECTDRETIIRQLALALQTSAWPGSTTIAERARQLTSAYRIEQLRELLAPSLEAEVTHSTTVAPSET